MIKRGRGIGQGTTYKSLFNVRDVPSRGNAHVIQGIKIPRRFHLLSDLEATHFLLRERDPKVLDIRENFPIFDIDWTMEACARIGIRHPYQDGHPFPFTLDFVLTESANREVADRVESIKTPADAADNKVRTRLTVEANWCRIRPKVPYALIDTSAYVDKQLLSMLTFMRAWFPRRYEPNTQREARFERVFSAGYERNIPLQELIQKGAKTMRLPEDLALDMFRFCAWHDWIPVSLKHPLAMNRPVIMR
jgi:hypothetical protein